MGAALYTGQDDIAMIMVQAGLGIAGIVIILLSTVTTTFLDAFSAGVSGNAIVKNLSEKALALVACLIGMILAITVDASRFEDFYILLVPSLHR